MHHDMKENELAGMTIMVNVVQGKNLLACDTNFIGRSTTSDAYVQGYYESEAMVRTSMGRTKTINKTLSPVWNDTLFLEVGADEAMSIMGGVVRTLTLRIFDEDLLSADDLMGTVDIPLTYSEIPESKWYNVTEGEGKYKCRAAKGEVEVMILFQGKRMNEVMKGQFVSFTQHDVELSVSHIAPEKLQIDTSIVAVDNYGNLLLDESAYYGNLTTSAVTYDFMDDGNDEMFLFKFEKIPSYLLAYYIVFSAGSKSFELVDSEFRFMSNGIGEFLYRIPSDLKKDATTIMVARLERSDGRDSNWRFRPIELAYGEQTRDFGCLWLQLKSVSRDIISKVTVQRVAILRKGGCIRLNDHISAPKLLGFSLSWIFAENSSIDLDFSLIILDKDGQNPEIISSGGSYVSEDGSVSLNTFETSVEIDMSNIRPDAACFGVVVNTRNGEILNDIIKISCCLYNPYDSADIAQYDLSNRGEMEDRTAFVISCLHLQNEEWFYNIISLPTLGDSAEDNVDELQGWLLRHPVSTEACSKYPSPQNEKNVEVVMPNATEVFLEEIPVAQENLREYI